MADEDMEGCDLIHMLACEYISTPKLHLDQLQQLVDSEEQSLVVARVPDVFSHRSNDLKILSI